MPAPDTSDEIGMPIKPSSPIRLINSVGNCFVSSITFTDGLTSFLTNFLMTSLTLIGPQLTYIPCIHLQAIIYIHKTLYLFSFRTNLLEHIAEEVDMDDIYYHLILRAELP